MRDTYPNISYVREALLKSNASLLEDRGSGFENVYHQPTFERLYLGSSKSNGKRMYQFLSVSHIKSCLLDVLIGGASKDFSSLSEASIDSLSGELALQQQLLSFQLDTSIAGRNLRKESRKLKLLRVLVQIKSKTLPKKFCISFTKHVLRAVQ